MAGIIFTSGTVLAKPNSCQVQNDREQKSRVINRIILWNRVLYYFGEYIILSKGITLREDSGRKEKTLEWSMT